MRVQDVNVVNWIDHKRLLPHIANRFGYEHLRADPRKAWTHQTAGFVFFVGEERQDFFARRFVET